ncbi:gypsy-like retrotransposase [Cucumis melo var. makuwa]|uniref:Gypsy-like retrotransposase n=1 Tax=Cucumis melo var. makuwa TaxID=1194695 RepID=A0A5D3D6I0_CUCMM|nr:gypsy-like retrotransposase [Cucumis melo var. makuwa]
MKDGFDPRAYKLMAKANYDFTAHTKFKSLKVHKQSELSLTQKKLLREGYIIPVSRKGLRYKSPEPIRITRKGKEKVVDSNHITIEEVDSMEEKEGSLKVKRHDVILTNPGKEGSKQEEGETSCHHITIIEELKIETPKEDMEDTPQSLEDGGQSIVDELKEVNIGTIEEPHPTFISASLSSEDGGVTLEKFLGFIVRHRGIEINQFISNLVGWCQNFQKLMRKGEKSMWDEACQNAFDSIKKYLLNPSILRAPVPGKSLILYIAVQERSGARTDIILISPEKHMLPYNFVLTELCSNNVIEYQALIIGLQMALKIGVSFIEVYGDSKLIINKLSLQYDVKHEDLKPYFAYA